VIQKIGQLCLFCVGNFEQDGIRMNKDLTFMALQSTPRSKCIHLSLTEALSKGPPPAGNLAVPLFSHAAIDVELYTPVDQDNQKPHRQDEAYFVARGTAFFFDGLERYRVGAGSFIYVPAGQQHRFENFSKDLAVWVIFFGPKATTP
jgi:mannose-6-phosphate isomerase-like protein (cupin superfamily)